MAQKKNSLALLSLSSSLCGETRKQTKTNKKKKATKATEKKIFLFKKKKVEEKENTELNKKAFV